MKLNFKAEDFFATKIFLTFFGLVLGSRDLIEAFGAYSFESEGEFPNSYFLALLLMFPFVFLVFLSNFWPSVCGLLMILEGLAALAFFAYCLKFCTPLFIEPPHQLLKFILFVSGPMMIMGAGFFAVGICMKKIGVH